MPNDDPSDGRTCSPGDRTDSPGHRTDSPDDRTPPPIDDDRIDSGRHSLCPTGGVMDLLGRRLAMPVVCVVGALGPVRFGEIEAAFGEVSTSTLSDRLEELTDAGLLERNQYDEIPPRVEYEVTADGAELYRVIEPLLEWADGWVPGSELDDGRPVESN